MKNLYPKGKGKIHPSPGSPSGAGASAEVLAVLKLLPATIIALTAVLGAEDKAVLAYLITRSINGPASSAAGDELRRCRRIAGEVHHAVLDCGCFDCYTSFWFRWDCSPNRELIHHAIEAFEENLAATERKIVGRGRRRERNRSEKRKKTPSIKESAAAAAAAEVDKAVEESSAAMDEVAAPEVVVKGVDDAAEVKREDRFDEIESPAITEENDEVIEGEAEPQPDLGAIGGERRRGWPDVLGIFFNLWSPRS